MDQILHLGVTIPEVFQDYREVTEAEVAEISSHPLPVVLYGLEHVTGLTHQMDPNPIFQHLTVDLEGIPIGILGGTIPEMGSSSRVDLGSRDSLADSVWIDTSLDLVETTTLSINCFLIVSTILLQSERHATFVYPYQIDHYTIVQRSSFKIIQPSLINIPYGIIFIPTFGKSLTFVSLPSIVLDSPNPMHLKPFDTNTKWWDEFTAKKPVAGKNHPDDEKLLATATETIGDYKLKESDDYKLAHHQKETTVKKYQQLLDARLWQYNLRHEFSQKVLDLRARKYEVRNFLIEKSNLLSTIHEELPDSMKKYGPPVPDINEEEFPEKKITPNVVVPEVSILEEGTEEEQPFVQPSDRDMEERQVIPETIFPTIQDGIRFKSTIDESTIDDVCNMDFKTLIKYPEDRDTPYEMDIKTRRLNRDLFIQSQTIVLMNNEIANFNQAISDLKDERLPNQVKGNYIDLYILTLNQELNILKLSEDIEDHLTEKVNENLRIVHEMEDILDGLNHKMETHQNEIEMCRIEEAKIQERFRHATENNKFFDFLRKVFKKKYKPPKVHTDDDSSSSSSSSSSSESEDDAASQDSEDFTIIKQDLNVCPKGCEQAIFDLTINLRTERHQYEQAEIEELRMIEVAKKDISLQMRKMVILQKNLQISVDELDTFQKEKQRKMNQVLCTVLLKIDQIYGFNPGTSDISDYLVFGKTTLSNLYKRVGILQRETYEQKSKHDTYLKHLMRMHKDMVYMKQRIRQLERDQVELMQQKFGSVIDLNEVEEAMIKKIVQKDPSE
ncbi:hypothetical protein NQ317_012496 [Molorchus minor]|uniref:Uncharacterized protein n=1 Tax=Molorchus minor TaxID=1323400 RepID=A0ABQ9K213_9CUCU|nr:hypothetical protein NQ317_012496 [Molorchus minor]